MKHESKLNDDSSTEKLQNTYNMTFFQPLTTFHHSNSPKDENVVEPNKTALADNKAMNSEENGRQPPVYFITQKERNEDH